MDLNEAASLLGFSKERALLCIEHGIELPRSRQRVRLRAESLERGLDIAQEDLDTFIAAFEQEEPGRHPAVHVRRELLIESGYQCAVCHSDAPLEFHHIIEWSSIKHHDPRHMLAVCGNCHGKMTRHGSPDVGAQKEIKRRLQARSEGRHGASEPPSEHLPAPSAHSAMPAPAQSSVQVDLPGSDEPAPQTRRGESTSAFARAAAMRQIFSAEITHLGPSDEELERIAGPLFTTNLSGYDINPMLRTLLLRTAQAIRQIQRITRPDVALTDWMRTDRLAVVLANVLAELGFTTYEFSLAKKYTNLALQDAREQGTFQFKDVDEWRPGMESGAGWVELASISRIGEKWLERVDGSAQ